MSVSLNSSHPSLPSNDSSYPILLEWKAKRKIQKHEGIGFSGHLIRVIGTIVAIALAIPVIAVAGLYNLYVSLKEKYIIRYYPDHILSVIRAAKQKENLDKFNAMVEVLKIFHGPLENASTSAIAKNFAQEAKLRLEDPAVVHNRGVRVILRMLTAQDDFNANWITVLKDPKIVNLLDFSNENVPQAFLAAVAQINPNLTFNINWSKVLHKVNKVNINPENIDKEIAKLERALKGLLDILKQNPESNSGKLNEQFIAAYRRVLDTPTYQALKENSSISVIKFMQRLPTAIYKAPAMDTHAKVGTKIAAMVNESLDPEMRNTPLSGQVMATKLKRSHKLTERAHYSAHGMSGVLYALTHPLQIMGALASEGGPARHIPRIFGLDVYDSHGTLANNPSLQGITKVYIRDDKRSYQATIDNFYTGSPTIGDHQIAPEFEALLMAAENNRMAPPDLQDASIPMMVNYNNLQNLDKTHGENARSRTIMLMNQKYPLSFRGTTFAKDSDLYLMPQEKDVVWQNPRQFGEIMLNQLLRSFNPHEVNHGFYFHGSKEMWNNIFEKIIENCNAHFEKLQPTVALSARDLQGAYQEYIYSMLIGFLDIDSIKKTASQVGIKNNFSIMSNTGCKENIDRGGMDNMKQVYLKDDEINENLLLGIAHNRAISSRDRVVLGPRMPQTLSFMRVVEPSEFKKNQQALFRELGLEVYPEYQPDITT